MTWIDLHWCAEDCAYRRSLWLRVWGGWGAVFLDGRRPFTLRLW